jgi:hypothetical protein
MPPVMPNAGWRPPTKLFCPTCCDDPVEEDHPTNKGQPTNRSPRSYELARKAR